MQEYQSFPPCKPFLKVLKAAPSAAKLYLDLWKCRNKSAFFSIKRDEIRSSFCTSPTLFRNQLMALVDLNVLSLDEEEDTYSIDFAFGTAE